MSSPLAPRESDMIRQANNYFKGMEDLQARKQQLSAKEQQLIAQKQQVSVQQQQLLDSKQKLCDTVKTTLDQYVSELEKKQKNLPPMQETAKLRLDGKLNTLVIEIKNVKNAVKVDTPPDHYRQILTIFSTKVSNLSIEIEREKTV